MNDYQASANRKWLRRVQLQREHEQEVAIDEADPAELQNCPACGQRVQDTGDTFCRRKECQQARELASEQQANTNRRRELVALALPRLTTENAMSETPPPEERQCADCGKRLNRNNQVGRCWQCSSKSAKPAGAQSNAPRSSASSGDADTIKRFKTVATALGVNPDRLLATFAEGWLERVAGAARFGVDTEG